MTVVENNHTTSVSTPRRRNARVSNAGLSRLRGQVFSFLRQPHRRSGIGKLWLGGKWTAVYLGVDTAWHCAFEDVSGFSGQGRNKMLTSPQLSHPRRPLRRNAFRSAFIPCPDFLRRRFVTTLRRFPGPGIPYSHFPRTFARSLLMQLESHLESHICLLVVGRLRQDMEP